MAGTVEMLSPQFWTSKSVENLGAHGKLLYALLITGPHVVNLPGLASASLDALCKWLRPLTRPDVEEALKSIVVAGKAIYDYDRELIRLPSVWKWHLLPNPNQIRGWKHQWLKFPDSSLRYDHLETLELLVHRGQNTDRIKTFRECFCGIVPGQPKTYELFGGGRKKRRADAPADPDLQVFLDKKIDHLYFSRKREPEDTTGTGTGTGTVTKPFGKGSGRVSESEGFGKGSERVREGFGKGFENTEYADDFGENDFEEEITDERPGSAGPEARNVSNGEPGSDPDPRPRAAPTLVPATEPVRDAPGPDVRGSGTVPDGASDVGRRSNLVALPVPPVFRTRYRHD